MLVVSAEYGIRCVFKTRHCTEILFFLQPSVRFLTTPEPSDYSICSTLDCLFTNQKPYTFTYEGTKLARNVSEIEPIESR